MPCPTADDLSVFPSPFVPVPSTGFPVLGQLHGVAWEVPRVEPPRRPDATQWTQAQHLRGVGTGHLQLHPPLAVRVPDTEHRVRRRRFKEGPHVTRCRAAKRPARAVPRGAATSPPGARRGTRNIGAGHLTHPPGRERAAQRRHAGDRQLDGRDRADRHHRQPEQHNTPPRDLDPSAHRTWRCPSHIVRPSAGPPRPPGAARGDLHPQGRAPPRACVRSGGPGGPQRVPRWHSNPSLSQAK